MSGPAPTGLLASRAAGRALQLTSLLLFLLAWESYGRRPDSFAVAPFTEVAVSLFEGLVGGTFLTPLAGTLTTFAVGYLISGVGGVLLGLWISASRWARNTIEPLVAAAYATPTSILIPILGIYVGFGFTGRVTLVVLWSMFEVVMNTVEGVRSVPQNLIEVGRSMNAGRRRMYTRVVLPAAAPQIVVGLRLSVGKAIRGAVTAEILLAVTNLGSVLVGAGSRFANDLLLATILLIMLLGLVLMQLARSAERRLFRWLEY